jgi:hypothetical protein
VITGAGALLVEGEDALRRGHDVRAKSVAVAKRLRREEATAQHLGGIFLRPHALPILVVTDALKW